MLPNLQTNNTYLRYVIRHLAHPGQWQYRAVASCVGVFLKMQMHDVGLGSGQGVKQALLLPPTFTRKHPTNTCHCRGGVTHRHIHTHTITIEFTTFTTNAHWSKLKDLFAVPHNHANTIHYLSTHYRTMAHVGARETRFGFFWRTNLLRLLGKKRKQTHSFVTKGGLHKRTEPDCSGMSRCVVWMSWSCTICQLSAMVTATIRRWCPSANRLRQTDRRTLLLSCWLMRTFTPGRWSLITRTHTHIYFELKHHVKNANDKTGTGTVFHQKPRCKCRLVKTVVLVKHVSSSARAYVTTPPFRTRT